MCDSNFAALPIANMSIAVLKHNAYDVYNMLDLPAAACQWVLDELPDLAQIYSASSLPSVEPADPFYPCAKVLLDGERATFVHWWGLG